MTGESPAALSVAKSLGLPADEAIVLQSSNRVTMRLLPCDTLARVGPGGQFELSMARQLAGSPVATPDPRVEPRVYSSDGYEVTLWTYYEPGEPPQAPAYADALRRLHEGMRKVDGPAPHFTDRIANALRLVADRESTPGLALPDRELLADTLERLRRAVVERGRPEQLLHGEPHPGNVLATRNGLLFIDLETCCRGPVEFDLAHAPEEVSMHYPGIDHDLLRDCRILVLALITTWRWDRNDKLPDGHRLGLEWLSEIRAALA